MKRSLTRTRPGAAVVFDMALASIGSAVCAESTVRIRNHAVEVACLARELAPLLQVPPGDAFAAGLLHDVGELLLLRHDPGGYRRLLAEVGHDHAAQLQAEKDTYGTDHAYLGAEHLLEHRLPDEVADAVADHHDPFGGSAPTTLVVAAADELLSGDESRRSAVDLLDLPQVAAIWLPGS